MTWDKQCTGNYLSRQWQNLAVLSNVETTHSPRGLDSDRQIGLTERVCAAISDTRHPGYITHSLHDILKQRIYQIASGYEDGNDCNSLRHDPVFRLSRRCSAHLRCGPRCRHRRWCPTRCACMRNSVTPPRPGTGRSNSQFKTWGLKLGAL